LLSAHFALCSYAERERRAGDCYKLSLTDGARRVVGFEHAALPWLRHDTPAGAKVAVTHAHVRRGLLLLTPQCAELLGGCAPRLEAARVRAVERWNAPPGCAAIDAAARRRAAATAAPGAAPPPPPSLAEAAAEAAWAPEAGQPPAVRGPPPAPAPAPAFAPSHHAPQQQQQPPRQQQAVPQVVSLLDDDDEDAPLGARLQRLRAGPSGDSPPLPPPQHQHAPPQPPPAHAPPQQQRREAPPPAQQQQRPPPQPPPLEPVAVRAASPVAMAGAFGGSHQAPLPGSGSKSGTSQRRPPWERFSGEPFTYIAVRASETTMSMRILSISGSMQRQTHACSLFCAGSAGAGGRRRAVPRARLHPRLRVDGAALQGAFSLAFSITIAPICVLTMRLSAVLGRI
jgi:hypothetical protein